jgi:hypothetical protein
MPPDIEARIAAAKRRGVRALGFERAVEHLHGVLIAGCRSDQTSEDANFQGRFNGALTYYFLKVLAGADGLHQALTTVIPEVTRKLKADNFDQEPQLRGDPHLIGLPFLDTR